MKKIISLFLIAILVCAMFAGCSQNDKQPNDTSENTTHSTTESTTNEEDATKRDAVDSIMVLGIRMGMQTNVKDYINQIDTNYKIKLMYTSDEFVLKEFTKENIDELYNMEIPATMYYLTVKFNIGNGEAECITLDIKHEDGIKVGNEKILSIHYLLMGKVITKDKKVLNFNESTPEDLRNILGKEDEFHNTVSELYTYINDEAEYEKIQFLFTEGKLRNVVLYNYH